MTDVTPTSPEPGAESTGAEDAERRAFTANAAETSSNAIVNGIAPDRRARPIVVAHRGSSVALPEHTIGAYMRAIAKAPTALNATFG